MPVYDGGHTQEKELLLGMHSPLKIFKNLNSNFIRLMAHFINPFLTKKTEKLSANNRCTINEFDGHDFQEIFIKLLKSKGFTNWD